MIYVYVYIYRCISCALNVQKCWFCFIKFVYTWMALKVLDYEDLPDLTHFSLNFHFFCVITVIISWSITITVILKIVIEFFFPKKLRSRVKRCYEVGLVINWGHACVNKLSRAKIKQIKQWTVHVPSASGLTPMRQCMADVYVTQDEIQPKFFLLSLTICDSSSSGIFYPVGVKTWIVIIIFYEFIYLLSSIVLIFWVPNQSEIEKFIPKMSPKARWKRKTHENTRKRKR